MLVGHILRASRTSAKHEPRYKHQQTKTNINTHKIDTSTTNRRLLGNGLVKLLPFRMFSRHHINVASLHGQPGRNELTHFHVFLFVVEKALWQPPDQHESGMRSTTYTGAGGSLAVSAATVATSPTRITNQKRKADRPLACVATVAGVFW